MSIIDISTPLDVTVAERALVLLRETLDEFPPLIEQTTVHAMHRIYLEREIENLEMALADYADSQSAGPLPGGGGKETGDEQDDIEKLRRASARLVDALNDQFPADADVFRKCLPFA